MKNECVVVPSRARSLWLCACALAVAAVSGALLFQKAQLTAMLRPGDTLTLREVSREAARAAHLAQERALRQAEWSLAL